MNPALETYGSIIKYLSQEQLIKVVNDKNNLPIDALLRYHWVSSNPNSKILIKDQNINHQNLFEWAISNKFMGLLKILLIDPRVNPCNKDNQAIIYASGKGYSKIVLALLAWTPKEKGSNCDRRVDPSAQNNQAIIDACDNGHDEIVLALFAWRGLNGERVDPNAQNNQAVKLAARRGRYRIIMLFFEWEGSNGEKIDFTSSQVVVNVLCWGGPKIANLLLSRDRVKYGRIPDPTTKNNLAIRNAARSNNFHMIKFLLAWTPRKGLKQVDPSAQDNQAVIYASKYGHVETLKMLLDWRGLNGERVDPSAQNNQAIIEASLFHYNHGCNYIEVVKLLLNDKRVDSRDQDNKAMVNASKKDYFKTIKLLLLDWRGPNGEKVNPVEDLK